MDRLRKRFVVLVVPVALILFASFLAAQGPPNPCVNACWQAYTDAVKACHAIRGVWPPHVQQLWPASRVAV